ncbi:MAG: hypothetical protein ACLQIB_24325 [Isosphaeraceae bacterium]
MSHLFDRLGTSVRGVQSTPTTLLLHCGDDTGHIVGRIGDRLRAALGKTEVVQPTSADVDIEKYLSNGSPVVVLVLGTGQLGLDDSRNRVRLGLEAALAQECTIIPVLPHGTQFPEGTDWPESLQPLRFLNGLLLRPDPHFDHDMQRLLRGVREPATLSEPPAPDSLLIAVLGRSCRGILAGLLLGFLLSPLLCVFPALFGVYLGARLRGASGVAPGCFAGLLSTFVFMIVIVSAEYGLPRLVRSERVGGAAAGVITGGIGGLLVATSLAANRLLSLERRAQRTKQPAYAVFGSGLGGMLLGMTVLAWAGWAVDFYRPDWRSAWAQACSGGLVGAFMGILGAVLLGNAAQSSSRRKD